jgi:hypothetical protein
MVPRHKQTEAHGYFVCLMTLGMHRSQTQETMGQSDRGREGHVELHAHVLVCMSLILRYIHGGANETTIAQWS